MKKALLTIAIGLSFAACKKDNKVTPTPTGLFGKWELAVMHGSTPSVKAPQGNGDVYEFKSDSTYVHYLDGKVQASGKFSINLTESRDTLRFGIIKFTGPDKNEAWAQSPNSFTLGTSIADGPSYTYFRFRTKYD